MLAFSRTITILSGRALLILLSILVAIYGTIQTHSLYYGQPTTDYEQSGYMIADVGEGKLSSCGINFVTDDTAVTAAHCLDDVRQVFGDTGNFNPDFQASSPKIREYNISPNYNERDFSFNPGMADVGVIKFQDKVNLSEYGKIDSPKEGCDYYMVGYGLDENQEPLNRTGVDVCIKNITEYSFELDFDGVAHFCQGDSGSGIYEKNGNKIVGVTSAFFSPVGSEDCRDGSAYIVSRLDYNLDYLKQNVPPEAFEASEKEDTETVPDDYFGEYHPETRKDDGSYNYDVDREIEKMIKERLSDKFDFYPEEGFDGDSFNFDENDGSNDLDEDTNEDEMGQGSDIDNESASGNQEEGSDEAESTNLSGIVIIIFFLIVIGLVFFPFLIIFLFIIWLLKRSKRNSKSNSHGPSQPSQTQFYSSQNTGYQPNQGMQNQPQPNSNNNFTPTNFQGSNQSNPNTNGNSTNDFNQPTPNSFNNSQENRKYQNPNNPNINRESTNGSEYNQGNSSNNSNYR